MKKILGIVVLGLLLNTQVHAEHERFYIKKKEEPQYKIYNLYVVDFNKWLDETEGDYSCSSKNLPSTVTKLLDISDCQYKKTLKYMKRNNININQIILDSQYDFYIDVRDRAMTLQQKWILDNKNLEKEWNQWGVYYKSEHEALRFYQRDIWTKFALKNNSEYLATKEKENDTDNGKKEKKEDSVDFFF